MITLGQRGISAIYYGDRPVTAVYRGAQKIWPANAVELAGTVSATSALSGALQVPRHLGGVVAAHSSISGNFSVSKPGILGGRIEAHSGLSGSLQVPRLLGATVSAASSVSGDMNAEVPTGYSFTMTAGADGAVTRGFVLDEFGNLSNQPIPGEIMGALIQSGNVIQCIFIGNILAKIAGKHLFIDDTDLGEPNTDLGDGPGWTYLSDDNVTVGGWYPVGETIVEFGVYECEFKEGVP